MTIGERLKRDYPGLMDEAWEVSIEDGWEHLVRAVLDLAVQERERMGEGGHAVKVAQIKEKFGGLRINWAGGTDKLFKASADAEVASFKTCEACGTSQGVETKGSWIKSLCGSCREARDTKKKNRLLGGDNSVGRQHGCQGEKDG